MGSLSRQSVSQRVLTRGAPLAHMHAELRARGSSPLANLLLRIRARASPVIYQLYLIAAQD